MKKENKILLAIFLFSVALRIVLAIFIKSPTIFSDEYVYAKMSQSFFEEQSFLLNDSPVAKYPPLYPIFISLSYLFGNMTLIYFIFKLINSLIISSAIFPLFFISRYFLNYKKALFISFFSMMVAPYLIFSNFVMAENLYFPLAIWAVFFIFASFLNNKWHSFLVAGIFSGLAILTKLFGFALVPIVGILWLKYRKEIKFKNVLIYYFTIALFVVPWMLRNFLSFGRNVNSLTGGYRSPWMLFDSLTTKIVPFLNWNVIYWSYLLVGCGVLFFIYLFLFKKAKDKSLEKASLITILFTFFTIIIAANLSTNYKYYLGHLISQSLLPGRIVGRYVEVVLPLIIIIGYIIFDKIKNYKFSKLYLISIATLFLFSTQLMSNALFPLNNGAFSLFGLLQKAVGFLNFSSSPTILLLILSSIMFLFLIFYLFFIVKKKTLVKFALFFILLNSLSGFAMVAWNGNLWYNSDQIAVSDYVNKYVSHDSTVFIDKNYCQKVINKNELNDNLCDSGNYASLMGFFITNKIKVGEVVDINNGDVFVSKSNVKELNKLFVTENGIVIYMG